MDSPQPDRIVTFQFSDHDEANEVFKHLDDLADDHRLDAAEIGVSRLTRRGNLRFKYASDHTGFKGALAGAFVWGVVGAVIGWFMAHRWSIEQHDLSGSMRAVGEHLEQGGGAVFVLTHPDGVEGVVTAVRELHPDAEGQVFELTREFVTELRDISPPAA